MDKAKLRQYAGDLRKNSTDAEKHLWYAYLQDEALGYDWHS